MNETSRQNWKAIAALADSIKAMGVDERGEKKLESIKADAEAALLSSEPNGSVEK